MASALTCMIGKPGRSERALIILINGGAHDTSFVLPRGQWQALLDTNHPQGLSQQLGSDIAPVQVTGHSLVLMQQTSGPNPTASWVERIGAPFNNSQSSKFADY
jgi:pullulanase/glycogen debranching enzyme